MPISFHYDSEQNVIFTYAAGAVSLDDIMSYYAEVENMSIDPQYSVLADFTEADTNLSYEDVSRMASRRRSVSCEAQSMKIAVVAKADLVFGIARMYDAILSDECFEVSAFRDRAKALQWLGVSERQNKHD